MAAAITANLIADVLWLPLGYLILRLGRRLLREWRDGLEQDRAQDRARTAQLLEQKLAEHRAAVAEQLSAHLGAPARETGSRA